MITIKIPHLNILNLNNLVLDYNGTLAVDGKIIESVINILKSLSFNLNIYIITADTYGFVEKQIKDIPCKLIILPPGNQDKAKLRFIEQLNAKETVCIGNGKNDRLMLKESSLGIVVIGREGAALDSLMAADVVCNSITDALDILLQTKRLVATLRL